MALITLTQRAVNKTLEIISKQDVIDGKSIIGLRVAIQGGGCAGFNYLLNLEKEDGDNKLGRDKIFEFDGKAPDGQNIKLKVFVDPVSILYIDGTSIDYVDTLEASGFKFENPNADKTCGCGKSFSA